LRELTFSRELTFLRERACLLHDTPLIVGIPCTLAARERQCTGGNALAIADENSR
jgi:hypothetical protein